MTNTTYKGLQVSWWRVPIERRASIKQTWQSCVNNPVCSLQQRLEIIDIVAQFGLYDGQKLCPSCRDGFSNAMEVISICIKRWDNNNNG